MAGPDQASADRQTMGKVIRHTTEQHSGIASYQREAVAPCTLARDDNPVTRARARAAEMLETAREEAERLRAEAYEEGYAWGLDEGRAAFQARASEAAALLRELTNEIARARQAYIDALEPEVAEFALEIARRILLREAATDRELARSVARHAIEHLLEREHVTLRVNPADLEAIRSEKAAILEAFDEIEQLHVVADAEVGRGGCIAAARTMEVDARLEAQFERIAAEVREGA